MSPSIVQDAANETTMTMTTKAVAVRAVPTARRRPRPQSVLWVNHKYTEGGRMFSDYDASNLRRTRGTHSGA